MNDLKEGTSVTASGELVITRIFDAPRELVWRAWTDPEHLRRLWGPRTFTAPTWRSDFRVGGKYLYCMRAPDGKDYWGTGEFIEILPLERIVLTDSFADPAGNPVLGSHYGMGDDWPMVLQITLLFEDVEGGGTKFTLRHVGLPAGEMRDGTGVGWNESFDKLAELLGETGDTMADSAKESANG